MNKKRPSSSDGHQTNRYIITKMWRSDKGGTCDEDNKKDVG
nr:MAG TPA: hypothetical protein [Caudoviricetes sp.]